MGDKRILHCRINRFGEEWVPTEDSPDFTKYDVAEMCTPPVLPRDGKSVFRGYTMELEIEERTDGFKYWRMVHDCKVTVDEELNVGIKIGEDWNPGQKNLIYERIILKSPPSHKRVGYSMPGYVLVMMGVLLYTCFHYYVKYKRNECCRSCGKYLTYSPHDVCYWCRFYKAEPIPAVLWEQMKAKDKEKREDINDTHQMTFFQNFDNFMKQGMHQNVWGTAPEEDAYEDDRMDMEAGYRDSYPSGKPIVPSELFETETGITVVRKKMFDKYGNQEFHPSFSTGSPARELYNKKKAFQIGYHKQLAESAKEKKRIQQEGGLLMLENRPETDSPPELTMVEYFDGNESGTKQKKKKKHKKKSPNKRIAFAAQNDKDDFASTKGITKRIKFGSDDDEPREGTFRPSMTAKPARSALKSGRTNRGSVGGGVKFDVGNQGDGSDESDSFDIDQMIDKVAGSAASRFGQAESEEEIRAREEREVRHRQEMMEGGKRGKERRKGGIVTASNKDKSIEASKDKSTEASRQEGNEGAKKNGGGIFGRGMSRWTKIAQNIQEETREAYIAQITSEPKNFMTMQRLGVLLKKEGDEEIKNDPVYAFQLFRCAALSLQKSVETRGVAATVKDQDFPWETLGEVHLRSWLLQGIKGDRKHLELSCDAWGHATRQEINKNNPKVFVHHASALQFMGNYKQSGFVLGSILTNFPTYSKLNSVCMQACVVLKSLHQFKQAAAYLENVMKYGPPAPYTPIDCMFIMGRIYEQWDHEEVDEGHGSTSFKAYNRIFNALKTEEIIPSMSNYEDWFGDAVTWCSMAEKCAAAGHYALASDFFQESIHRYEDVEYHTPLAVLHFENAKCLCRSGKMQEAKSELQVALKIDQNNKKMFEVWKEWEEPNHIFENQLKLPGHKFVKKLSALIPTVTAEHQHH